MKICILRHAYFPDDPRDRKQAFALVDAGHSVTVICLRKNGQLSRETLDGVEVLRLPLTHKRQGIVRYFAEYAASFFFMMTAVTFTFFRRRYDRIQVSTMPDFLVFTTLIPKLFGAKIILDVHEPTPELWITKYGLSKSQILLQLQTRMEQRAIRYADTCITVTDALRRRLVERGASSERIHVIPNVCDEVFLNDSTT